MSQLEKILDVESENEHLAFLFFSQLIVRKFNSDASKMRENLLTQDENEEYALGHALGLKDLKKVINMTKSK